MQKTWFHAYGFDPPLVTAYIIHAHWLLTEALRPRLKDLGLMPGQERLLLMLEVLGPLVTVTQVAESAGVKVQTVSMAAIRAERHGLLRRIPDPYDCRLKRLILTKHGHETARRTRSEWRRVESMLRARFSPADIRGLLVDLDTALIGMSLRAHQSRRSPA